MSFIEPQVKKRILDVNAEIAELKGSLSDKETKIYLAKFLIHNLSFTFKNLVMKRNLSTEEIPVVTRGSHFIMRTSA